MGATIQVPTVFSAKDKLTKVVSKMTRGVRKFSKNSIAAIQRFDNRITKTYKKLGKFSKIALGLGIGAIFAMAIQNNIAYEDSLASVSSITGATGKELANLEQMSMSTAKSQKMLGAEVLKAYELIGSAQPTLLKNTKLLDEVTNAAITLSKAGRMELEPAAIALTTTLNQFGLGGEHAKKVIDNLAAGSVAGASNITQTADAIKKFGTNAAAAGIKVNESIALIQLASPFEKGAEAGTKLRNILQKMSGARVLPPEQLKMLKKAGVDIDLITNKTKPLKDRLLELSKVAKNSDAMSKIFGADSGLAQGLFDNAKGFGAMLKEVNKTNVATEQAKTNTDTFAFALESIKTSFLNVTTATQTNNSALGFLKDILVFVSDNMATLVGVAGTLIASYGVMKAVIWATRAALFAKNVVLGVQIALGQKSIMALRGNTVAMNAYKIAMGVGTAATWIATAATTAFGIALNLGLWPILAIIAAVAAVIAVIMNWSSIVNWFGEKWAAFTEGISNAWGSVVSFFQDFSLVAALKSIGKAIIGFVLTPVRWLLKLLSYLPGSLGNAAETGLKKIDSFLDGDDDKAAKKVVEIKNKAAESKDKEVIPSTAQTASEQITKQVTESKSNLNVNIKDKGANVESVDGDDNIPVKVTSTQGAF